jgi:hypothetical protein
MTALQRRLHAACWRLRNTDLTGHEMHFLKFTAASSSFFLLCLALTACGGGGGGNSSVNAGCANLGSTAFASTSVSGKVTFDLVPVAVNGARPQLNYAATVRQPARAIVVESVDCSSGQVLATATTSATGDYALVVPNNRTVFIRALAQMTSIGGNPAPFVVVDNTDSGALWATDSALFGSGTVAALTQNLNAGSGWTGTAYDNTQRAAGPFAILDTAYQAAQKIIASDLAVAFVPLEFNWSPNNITASGNRALGQIGITFFTIGSGSNGAATRQIYVLGYANNDTDEYDRHVVAHEFGHYLQNAFSRDDSVGGSHRPGDRLDMRVAFSEGWGNAWSGLALNNAVYADTKFTNQVGGITFNVSQGESTNPGWFKEGSVQKVLWDFSNSPAIGFTSVWNALKSGLSRSAALAGIHSFSRALADANPAAAPTISAILGTQGITLTTSPYAETETNFGAPAMPNTSPLYLTYPGSTLGNICVDSAADLNLDGNKAGEIRYVRLSLPQAGTRSFNVSQTSSSSGSSDPDFVLYDRSGGIFQSNGTAVNVENASTILPAGDYVLAITDFNLSSPPTRSALNTSSCFSLTVQ